MPSSCLHSVSDDELVLRIGARDVRAFEVIFDRYSEQAFGLAMYITGRRGAAEEVTQDAFLSLWRTSAGYDPARGTLKTWVLAIVRNRAIDSLRQSARHGRNVEINDSITAGLRAPDCPEADVLGEEESRRTRESLTSLPSAQREVIELAFFKGLTQRQIAIKIGIPLGTVKGRQRLGLQKLQLALGRDRHSRPAQPAAGSANTVSSASSIG